MLDTTYQKLYAEFSEDFELHLAMQFSLSTIPSRTEQLMQQQARWEQLSIEPQDLDNLAEQMSWFIELCEDDSLTAALRKRIEKLIQACESNLFAIKQHTFSDEHDDVELFDDPGQLIVTDFAFNHADVFFREHGVFQHTIAP